MYIEGWLYYYLIFALSGSILTWFSIYRPCIKIIGETNPKHIMYTRSCLGSMVWLVMAFITMPFLVIPSLVPSTNENFKNSLIIGFLKKDKQG